MNEEKETLNLCVENIKILEKWLTIFIITFVVWDAIFMGLIFYIFLTLMKVAQ